MDTLTALVFIEALTVTNSITAFLLWRARPGLPGLAQLSAGCLLMALGFALLTVRLPPVIVIANVIMTAAIAAATEGLVMLTGGRPRPRLLPVLTALTAVLWTAMLWLVPDATGLRVAVASALYGGLYARLLWQVVQNGQRFGVARTCLTVSLSCHLAVLAGRAGAALLHPDPDFTFAPLPLSLFLLEGAVMMTLTFFAAMMMVGTRLDDDLKERTHTLMAERRMHGHLRQFLSMLGHELRTPLAIIDRAAELGLLLLDPPQPAVTTRLQTIRTAVTRARTLMDRLLLAERAELDGSSGDLIDMAQLIRDIIQSLAEKYDSDRILSDLPASGTAGGVMVQGDREMLAVAVSNLLDNALKYSQPDQPVEISLHGGAMIRISVRDRGIGFPPEQLSRVGQRFFRAANANTIAGTGLGISIVKTILTRHQGHLTLRNRKHGGADATLHLPAAS